MFNWTSFVPPAIVRDFCFSQVRVVSISSSENVSPDHPIPRLPIAWTIISSLSCSIRALLNLTADEAKPGALARVSSIVRFCVKACAAFLIWNPSNWALIALSASLPFSTGEYFNTISFVSSRVLLPPCEPEVLIPAWVDLSNWSSRLPALQPLSTPPITSVESACALLNTV